MELSGVIIPDGEGRILLLHRNTSNRTQWEIPGGKIEPSEDAATAASREAYEELGITVDIVRELGTESFREDGYTISYTWYLARTNGYVPKIGEPAKFDDIRYWSMPELSAMTAHLSENTKNFIAKVDQNVISIS
ncbi:NUDIX hydrolase [Nocardia sp. NPDC003726]